MSQHNQMSQDVRYCTTDDGVRIAYSVEGEGLPLLFCHFVYGFSLSHYVPAFDAAVREIGRGHRLIRYDVRGTGLSEREVDDLTPAGLMLDLEAVVDALGLEPFVVLGAAIGGMRAVAYAAEHPERVAGLVLYETMPRTADAFPRPVLQAIAQLARHNWRLATRTMTDQGIRRDDEAEGLAWAQMLEASLPGETMAQMMETHMDLDITEVLERVACPALVCHSRNDRLYPFELGVRMARLIPNAQLVPLDTEEAGPFTNAGQAIAAIRAFLLAQLPHAAGATSVERDSVVRLSPRELEVLRLIAVGKTSGEISAELLLSIRTVGRHITNIYGKIGARGRADAANYARKHRIITD